MKLIPLSKFGKNRGKYFAQVDDEDYDSLIEYNWCIIRSYKTIYAARKIIIDGKEKMIMMHRQIMGKDVTFDHIDRNGLNDQKNNLRECSASNNCANRSSWGVSKFKGVSFFADGKRIKQWSSAVQKDKKKIYLGSFKTEIEAAIAYDKMAKEIYGEFANLNFPNS